jgi:peptide/nickel transport system substrate-binding protein
MNIVCFDPNTSNAGNYSALWMEKLFQDDWTTNPTTFDFKIDWTPPSLAQGLLCDTYEFTDPSTLILHVHHGIHWQNLPPVNGRELTADDIVYHFDREFGLGGGFKPGIYEGNNTITTEVSSVTSQDTYTVLMKWKISNPEFIMETLESTGPDNSIECPDAVKAYGDLSDWHHAVGSGAYILQDYVSGTSLTVVKNQSYWRNDSRYPDNKLPYIDKITVLIIPDNATALSGLRSGKIDAVDNLSSQEATNLKATNAELLQVTAPSQATSTVDPRNDKAPFNDIRVREALQMAINLPDIAANYYSGTTSPNPSSLSSQYLNVSGWSFPYDQWPQDLKDQYAFNVPQAKALLTAAGFPNGFDTDVVADQASDLALLQIVQNYFAAINVRMTIRTMETTAWNNYVFYSHSNDALSYRATGTLGAHYEPFAQLFYSFNSQWITDACMVNDPVFDAFYTNAMAATTIAGYQKQLVDANKWVAQQHYSISLLQPMVYGVYQPWFKGYNGQCFSISGGSYPNMGKYYLDQFWIDSKLKASMGK